MNDADAQSQHSKLLGGHNANDGQMRLQAKMLDGERVDGLVCMRHTTTLVACLHQTCVHAAGIHNVMSLASAWMLQARRIQNV